MTIAGLTFTVDQSGVGCSLSINPTNASFGAEGGPGSIAITANDPGCAWTAASNDGFITITSTNAGSGNGSVDYLVATNTSIDALTGTMTIAGSTFTVNQSGRGATADLAITKTNAPDPALVGTNLVYTLTVTNGGPDDARSVTVTDPLPTNVTFVSAISSQGTVSHLANSVSGNLGTLTNGASATVTILVTPTAPGLLTNVASVSTSDTDTNSANNSAMSIATVNGPPQADLAITNIASPNPVFFGSNITYSITVTNLGPSLASSVTVTDALPSNTTFASVSSSQGTCTQIAGVVTCNLSNLDINASAVISLVITSRTVHAITNTVTVNGLITDPDNNNTAVTVTTISVHELRRDRHQPAENRHAVRLQNQPDQTCQGHDPEPQPAIRDDQ